MSLASNRSPQRRGILDWIKMGARAFSVDIESAFRGTFHCPSLRGGEADEAIQGGSARPFDVALDCFACGSQ